MGTEEPGTLPVTFRAAFTRELRARREQMGLTQREFAEKAHVSLSSVKQYEGGRKRPARNFAAWCDGFYGCPGTFERLYDGMAAESCPSLFGSRVLLEDKAAFIHEWEVRGIPGLLQTRAYASAVIRACRPYDLEEDLEREAAARTGRQGILARGGPPGLWAVLGEGVLRQAVGGPRVMREQVDHLIGVAELQGIVVQVLPFGASDAPGTDGPAALFEFGDSPPVAYLEGWGSGRLVKDQKEVAAIATAIDMIKGCALSPAGSVRLMKRIRSELWAARLSPGWHGPACTCGACSKATRGHPVRETGNSGDTTERKRDTHPLVSPGPLGIPPCGRASWELAELPGFWRAPGDSTGQP